MSGEWQPGQVRVSCMSRVIAERGNQGMEPTRRSGGGNPRR
jgi:hypothetical protein